MFLIYVPGKNRAVSQNWFSLIWMITAFILDILSNLSKDNIVIGFKYYNSYLKQNNKLSTVASSDHIISSLHTSYISFVEKSYKI